MSGSGNQFDRLGMIDSQSPRREDARRALFSSYEKTVPLGAVWLNCSSCRRSTPVTFANALRAAVPSIHLPLVKRKYPSWMRCPACRRRTWVRVSVRIR